MGEKLTKEERANLNWAREIDDAGTVPFMAPSTIRSGPIASCEALVERGLLSRRMAKRSRWGEPRLAGYHVTPAGRAALKEPADGR